MWLCFFLILFVLEKSKHKTNVFFTDSNSSLDPFYWDINFWPDFYSTSVLTYSIDLLIMILFGEYVMLDIYLRFSFHHHYLIYKLKSYKKQLLNGTSILDSTVKNSSCFFLEKVFQNLFFKRRKRKVAARLFASV